MTISPQPTVAAVTRPSLWEAVALVIRVVLTNMRTCVVFALPAAVLLGAALLIPQEIAWGMERATSLGDVTILLVAAGAVIASSGTSLVAFALVYPLSVAGIAWTAARSVLDRDATSNPARPTIGDAGARLARRGPSVVGAFALTLLIVSAAPVALSVLTVAALVGFGPGAAAIGVLLVAVSVVWPAFFYAVRLSLALPAVVDEDLGATAGLARSDDLVRGAFAWVLGIVVVGSLLGSITGSVLSMPFAFAGGSAGWFVAMAGQMLALVASISFTGVALGVAYAARVLPPRPEPEPDVAEPVG